MVAKLKGIDAFDTKAIYEKGGKFIKLMTFGGNTYEVPLDVPVQQIIPLKDGLLIEAKNDKRQINRADNFLFTNQRDQSIVHFSLTGHPLNDPCLLELQGNIVAASTSSGLVMTQDSHQLRLIHLKKSPNPLEGLEPGSDEWNHEHNKLISKDSRHD